MLSYSFSLSYSQLVSCVQLSCKLLFPKILGLEEKVRKLKTDLKRAQDKNKYSDGEVRLCIVQGCLGACRPDWLSDCLTLWLSDYPTVWLSDCLSNWLPDWLDDQLLACLLVLLIALFICPQLYLNLQIQQYSRNIEELKSQLGVSQEKLQKQSQEAARRDEQLVVLKVELATLQEKHRLIQDEVTQRFLVSMHGHN